MERRAFVAGTLALVARSIGLTFRKALRLGSLHVNLSSSGVGLSTGPAAGSGSGGQGL